MFDLTNKIAVITGAGSGIGQAIASLFAKQGAHAVVLDMNPEASSATAESIRRSGGRAMSVSCDVSRGAEVKKVFRGIESELQRIDILVNNAGIAHIGTLSNTSE